ncbi:MAG: DUF2849 domain-containing protein [Rhodospirillales bacterium]
MTEEEQVALKIFTANRLSDGIVVFLCGDGSWTEAPDASGVIGSTDMETRMKAVADAAEEAAIVVGPYPIEVSNEGGDVRPLSLRESIRAYGPTTHPEFAKQSAVANKGY